MVTDCSARVVYLWNQPNAYTIFLMIAHRIMTIIEIEILMMLPFVYIFHEDQQVVKQGLVAPLKTQFWMHHAWTMFVLFDCLIISKVKLEVSTSVYIGGIRILRKDMKKNPPMTIKSTINTCKIYRGSRSLHVTCAFSHKIPIGSVLHLIIFTSSR